MSLKNGMVLKQRYRILSTLGKGGQGAVYLCEDIDVYNQKRAIKQFLNMQSMSREERQTALAMFKKEGAFLAMLDHQGLPKISDKFSSNGRCYLVIDYVEGQNLETILKEDPSFLNEGRIVDIALKLCDILNYMHTRVPPIVFRDVKPENIILTKDFQVKLIDFGTARFFDKRKKNDTIQVGTVGYAAPEQYTGTSDPASDIYAFGALLHHLLTGLDPKYLSPFEAERIPVCSIKKGFSENIAAVVHKALQSSRKKRYNNIADMKLDLLKNELINICPICGNVMLAENKQCGQCGTKILSKVLQKNHSKKLHYLETSDGLVHKTAYLHKDLLSIGRAQSNDIVIKDGTVSSRHAVLERKNNKFMITDLGSANGILINGKKVIHKKLKPGAQVKLGNVVLFYKMKSN